MKRRAKTNWKLIGLISGAAVAALVFPTIKLVQFLRAKIADRKSKASGGEAPIKAFSPAYRGKHKPHHRHANGHTASHAAGPDLA